MLVHLFLESSIVRLLLYKICSEYLYMGIAALEAFHTVFGFFLPVWGDSKLQMYLGLFKK